MAERKRGVIGTMNTLHKIRQLFSTELPFFFSIPALLWQLLFLFMPLAVMVFISFVDRSAIASSLIVTVKNYVRIFDFLHVHIIANSLLLGLVVAFSCLFVAYPVAYYLAFRAGRLKQILLFFLVVPFWTNLLILVYAWFFILERDGLINTLFLKMGLISEPIGLLNNVFAVAIVMFYCYVPFMIMPIINALEKIDKSLIEASSDLGATHLQTFLRVVLPLSWPGIRTGFFLVFVLTFGEFAIPLLMGGDKYVFVGTAISYYVLNALELEKGAAFTCMSGVALLLTIFILNWVLKRLVHRW